MKGYEMKRNFSKSRLLLIVGFILLAILWFYRYQRLKLIPPKNPVPVKIQTTLLEEPYFKGQSQYFRLRNIRIRARRYPKYQYGDRLLVVGELRPNLSISFPKITVMDEKTTGSIRFRRWLISIRQRGLRVINENLPEPQASLLAGILLGIKRGMPEDFSRALSITGTAHVVVASGANISLLASMVENVASVLGRVLSPLISSTIVIFYALMVGAEAPIRRATIMGVLLIIGKYLGRPTNVTYILIFTSIVMLIIDPLIINDLGFQLSFLSSFGISTIEPLLKIYLPINWFSFGASYFWTTVSAQIMIWPILAARFQNVSLVSPLVNTFVLWTISPIISLGLLLIGTRLISNLISRLISVILWIPLSYFVSVITLFSNQPIAELKIDKVKPFFFIVYYLIALSMITYFYRRADLSQSGDEASVVRCET